MVTIILIGIVGSVITKSVVTATATTRRQEDETRTLTTAKVAMERIARVAGVKPPRLSLPRVLAMPIGWAGDLAAKLSGKEPLVSSVTVAWGYCTSFQFSSTLDVS